MDIEEKFIEYCEEVLRPALGNLSIGIIKKAKSRNQLKKNPDLYELLDFIGLVESNISLITGKNKASHLCNNLKNKAIELTKKQEEISLDSDIDKEINTFLSENTLPTENDVSDYARYLTIKFGADAEEVEKDLIKKIKIHIKNVINKTKIDKEINTFLSRYPNPDKTDIDDIIKYFTFLNINFSEDKIRGQIEKERLFRKFRKTDEIEEGLSELDGFVDTLKNYSDNKNIKKVLQKQKLSYLVKDESGISDELLSEFTDLVATNEEDLKEILEGIGLKHMVDK